MYSNELTGQKVTSNVPSSLRAGDVLIGLPTGGWTTIEANNPNTQVDAGPNLKYGYAAGLNNQGTFASAVGLFAGNANQGAGGTAIGGYAANNAQGTNATAVGFLAGSTGQGSGASAVGHYAGQTDQGHSSVAVGVESGRTDQGFHAIAVGNQAGLSSQGDYTVAVGKQAGEDNQSSHSIAMGHEAGLLNQGDAGGYSIAFGRAAGKTNQGSGCVAIGHKAGETNQTAGSVVINGGISDLNAGNAGTFINPIREQEGVINVPYEIQQLNYNPTTKEIFKGGACTFKKSISISTNTNLQVLGSLRTGSIVKVYAMVEGNFNWYSYATFVRFNTAAKIYSAGNSSANMNFSVSSGNGIQLNVNHLGGGPYEVNYVMQFLVD